MHVTTSQLWRLVALSLVSVMVACGGGSDATAPAQPQGVACDPRVGIYAVASQGNPSPAANAAVADVVRKLQQSTGLGYLPLNKVSGFEEAGAVHYLVFYVVDTATYRLVDGETAVVLSAGTALSNLDEFLAYLKSSVRSAIDNHDQVASGTPIPADVAAGACVDITYSVNSTQGRVVARSSLGTLSGTAQADGSSTLRVSGGKVEGFRLAVPTDTPPGAYAISMQGVCRYAPSKVVANLPPMPVQVKASVSSAVSIADNFTTVDGGMHHKLTLDSGSWLLGEAGLYLSGKVTVAFGAVSGAVFTNASVVAKDNCFSAGCTSVTIEGLDAQGAARSVSVEIGGGKTVTVNSSDHGFAKVSRLRLNTLEASFSQLRASGTAVPAACTL
jgi:hypothetical protein